jgi:hypothetical protein
VPNNLFAALKSADNITTRDSRADSAFVVEGQHDAGAVLAELAVLDLHVHCDQFGNAQLIAAFPSTHNARGSSDLSQTSRHNHLTLKLRAFGVQSIRAFV